MTHATLTEFARAVDSLRQPLAPRDDLSRLRSLFPEDLAALALDANPLDLPPLVQALAEALEACADSADRIAQLEAELEDLRGGV